MKLQPIALDHIVLRCRDVETTVSWYVDQLGLTPVRLDEWRRREVPFPSVRCAPESIIDLIPGLSDEGRLEHLCITVEPTDLGALAASGRFEVLEGPVARFGARGMATSLYVRDPDGTTVEIRHY